MSNEQFTPEWSPEVVAQMAKLKAANNQGSASSAPVAQSFNEALRAPVKGLIVQEPTPRKPCKK